MSGKMVFNPVTRKYEFPAPEKRASSVGRGDHDYQLLTIKHEKADQIAKLIGFVTNNPESGDAYADAKSMRIQISRVVNQFAEDAIETAIANYGKVITTSEPKAEPKKPVENKKS